MASGGGGGGSTELKLFEALETYTNNESFCSKASFVRNFLERDLDLNNTQQSVQIDDILEEELGEEEEEEEVISLLSDSSEGDCDTSYISVCSKNLEEDLRNESRASPVNGGRSIRSPLSLGRGRDELLSLLLKKYGGNKGIVEEKEDEEEEDQEEDVLSTVEEDEEEEEEEEDDGVERVEATISNLDDNSIDVVEESEDDAGIKNWTQYFQLTELKRSLEEQQVQLEKEKESFTKLKSSEETRLKGEKKRVESQRKSLQTLISDYNKIKFSREEYEEKVKNLSDQLKETKLQMNKRISRFSDQQKRLEERVKALEKENEELKKCQPKSIPQRLAALKRPPMRCLSNSKKPPLQKPASRDTQQRRVQFADDIEGDGEEDEEKENGSTNVSRNSSSSFASDNSPSGSGAAGNSEEQKDSQSAKEVNLSDDEADKTMPSDYLEVRHPCGTITRVTKDNKMTRHILINQDVMDEFEDCSVRYYYRELGFAQTTYPNGDEIIEYDSGEIETRRADGSKIYTYADGLVKMIDGASGSEEVIFGDGSVVRKGKDGETTITWPSGQKEVRTATHVKRIYTNGTVKIMYQDGSEETRYYNGRVRRKDKNGVLVDDTKKGKQTNC